MKVAIHSGFTWAFCVWIVIGLNFQDGKIFAIVCRFKVYVVLTPSYLGQSCLENGFSFNSDLPSLLKEIWNLELQRFLRTFMCYEVKILHLCYLSNAS
jgi:hypothetical protein